MAVVLIGLLSASTVFAWDGIIPVSELKPAQSMEKPQLTGVGGKLILSDSPESFTEQGAFYRDRVSGSFRVFWHHQNMSSEPLTVAVAITNESEEEVKLFSEGSGVGTNYYVDVAGQNALAEFMRVNFKKQFLASLAPGESYYLESLTPSTFTNSGIAQFLANTKKGNRPATVTVTVLNYKDRPAHPETVTVLPGDSHTRGTFPHYDRIGTLKYNTGMGNALIRISSAESGQWSDAMPGEYEQGYNAVDGRTVVNNGNYGVMYRLSVDIENDHRRPRAVTLYHNPSGGAGHYVVKWQNRLELSGYITYEQAWPFANFTLNPKGRIYKSEISLTGGAPGPHVIYFTNQER
ncbi:hypothetical protein [Paenibacillus sp. J2TS4]|uniref:hypothetical protein n=1 Tax=Paenibacillus sp. J2TS4 TaxID=2807194 RepID=UPI001B1D8750|nr:hypothetical protein [Paenibacillus sp. J2TS4]GIP32241.1 hypothetical protein J2TS4_14510 [Paenibacillus sp. J2TS4]